MPTHEAIVKSAARARPILDYFNGVLTPALASWIEAAVANNTYTEAALFEKFRKSSPAYDGYTWSKDGKTAVLELAEDLAEDLGIHPRVEVEFLMAARLMLEGLPALQAFLESYAQVFRAEVTQLLGVWLADKPRWVSEEAVVRWAMEKTRQGSQYRMHPLEVYLADVSQDKLASLGIRAGLAGARATVHAAFEVELVGIAVPLEAKIGWSDFIRALWVCQVDSLEAATAHVLKELSHAPRVRLQKAVNDFCEQGLSLQPSPQQLAALGFEASEWAQLVASLLRGHDIARPAEFAKMLTRRIEQRKREVALRNCARALPSRISEMYPLARSLKRKLTLVVGPTNSGKTYRAVERMKTADRSLYLGPLRLLALEIRDRLEDEGFPTSLVTGELIEEVEGAKATASTIEMLDFDRAVDVVVIDEVQMMADAQRGCAWVQAIIGAAAKEVWMLGAPEALDAVQALAEYLQEPLEIVRTERLSPLSVDKTPTALGSIPAQSAVVAFSRREVLDLATELKEQHGRKVSVIYGALSPEVRREQAEKFRAGEHDVVVATDAISMGLNLPVQRMYFSTAVKWNGVEEEPIPADLTWQIAGRAGRFGHHDQGHVGALDRHTLHFVQDTLRHRPSPIEQVFRHGPTWPLVSAIAASLGLQSLADILQVFLKEFRLGADKRFISAIGEEQLDVAALVDRYGLTLREKLTLSNAPIPMVKGEIPDVFFRMVRALEQRKPLSFAELSAYHSDRASASQLDAEYAVKVLTLYCWLHYRFPEVFADFEEAKRHIDALNVAISRHLGRAKSRRCRECNTPLRVKHPHPMCDACFRASRGWASFGYQ